MGQCDAVELEFQRNRVVHGDHFTHPQQIIWEASNSIDEFRRVTTIDLVAKSPIHEDPPSILL
jgi:hypothetical protein